MYKKITQKYMLALWIFNRPSSQSSTTAFSLIESVIGGKVYNLIKSMYTNGQCSVKIRTKKTEYFFQECGARQGCNLSRTLFNIYINELAKQLENSPAVGLK